MAQLGFRNQSAQLKPKVCKVQGEIPEWLNGVLYRAGPGTFTLERSDEGKERIKEFSHWFDGLQLIHRFEIKGSQSLVRYSSRGNADSVGELFLNNPNGMMFFGRQPADPCESTFGRFFQIFKAALAGGEGVFPANVNVVPTMRFPGKKGKLVISTDANMQDVLEAETLVSSGTTSFKAVMSQLGGTLTAAHHQIDPSTGILYNFCQDFGPRRQFRVFSIEGDEGTGKLLATVGSQRLSYIHSFAMTERYLVFVCQPWIYQPMKIPLSGRLMDSLNWDPSADCKYFIIDRINGGGVVKECRSQPFFFFHTINAYETSVGGGEGAVDSLVIDLCGYEDPKIVDALHLDNLRKETMLVPKSELYRIRLPLPGTEQAEAVVTKIGHPEFSVELPQINPKINGRKNQYWYACAGPHDKRAALFDRIVKMENDWQHDSVSAQVWHAPDGGVPGEPVFVANPRGKGEDDGVVLTVVLDQTACQSYLAILDAKDMKELGRAWLDTVIAYNFHGEFTSN